MKKISRTTILFIGFFGLLCTQAQAHFPWINTSNYSPEPGESVQMTMGWGHRYPLGKFLKKADLENIVIVAPDGKKEAAVSLSDLEFEPANNFSTAGAYLVGAKRKTGFYTKTTEGGKRQSKESLNNVIKCSRSQMTMKSIINVGDGRGKVDRKLGHPLEIIPLANPAELKAGDYLPVQVLLHGKPYNDRIFATYMGFSTEKNVFAYTSMTDRQGMGRIRLDQPGVWLIKVEHQQPYADQNVCDVESFIATLTLEVK
ncbi:MAG: DUF4198 domain-containing protein [Proteobacteria bacterium]|nr:DUF4198 domain-containing protein [Pseudomonadota bacterium]MBU1640555.1 DUF4198 domain-containing protein [Pseudomonadota bacterium]